MTNRLVVLLTVVAIGSGTGTNCAAEPSHGIDVSQLRPGARVEIRTASVVDLPGVVKVRVVDGSLQTTLQGQIVKQSDKTLTVCPPGCAAPVVVPKPNVTLAGVILVVESGVALISLETEPHDVVMLPVAAIASLKTKGKGDLVDAPIAITVGDVVETPSTTTEPHSPVARRDVVIGGARFEEVAIAGQEAPTLVPSPKTRLEGTIEAADGDVLTVRLLGRSQVVTVPRAAIASLNIRRSGTHAGSGALIGAAVGLAAGLAFIIVANHPNDSDYEWQPVSAIGDVILLAVPAAGGTLIGAVAGGLTHTDRWERVDPKRLSIAVMPDPHGGIRGRLAVRF